MKFNCCFFFKMATDKSINAVYLLLAVMQTQARINGQCVMYSECEQTDSGPLPCTYNGQPVTLKDPKSLQILKNYCPDLFEDFQNSVRNITINIENKEFGLKDICYRPHYGSDSCAVFSILEYWQRNHSALDKVRMDEYGFFVLADYLDHFFSCAVKEKDTVGLNLSCKSTANEAIYPNMVLAGYGGGNQEQHFNSSTAFIITFLVQNYQDDRMNDVSRAWERELRRFVHNFHSPNMTLSVKTPSF